MRLDADLIGLCSFISVSKTLKTFNANLIYILISSNFVCFSRNSCLVTDSDALAL